MDSQELVVLADPVGPAGRASLYLAYAGGYRQVGDGDIFCFAAAMAYYGSVTVGPGEVDRFERLGQCPDLVDLYKYRICAAELDPFGKPFGIGYEQVVADYLYLCRVFWSSSPSPPSRLLRGRLRC